MPEASSDRGVSSFSSHLVRDAHLPSQVVPRHKLEVLRGKRLSQKTSETHGSDYPEVHIHLGTGNEARKTALALARFLSLTASPQFNEMEAFMRHALPEVRSGEREEVMYRLAMSLMSSECPVLAARVHFNPASGRVSLGLSVLPYQVFDQEPAQD